MNESQMGHTFSQLLIHAIFSTKGRRPLIREDFRNRLYQYMGGVAKSEFGRALAIGGTDNHVHALLSVRTSISISNSMNRFKSLSTGWLHKTIPNTSDFAWQPGYGAFSVSPSNAEEVIAYIDGQSDHHKETTFEEEFQAFLERHQVSYDPDRIWD